MIFKSYCKNQFVLPRPLYLILRVNMKLRFSVTSSRVTWSVRVGGSAGRRWLDESDCEVACLLRFSPLIRVVRVAELPHAVLALVESTEVPGPYHILLATYTRHLIQNFVHWKFLYFKNSSLFLVIRTYIVQVFFFLNLFMKLIEITSMNVFISIHAVKFECVSVWELSYLEYY